MRIYYCFIIQKDFLPIYKRNSEVLYQTLYQLYTMKQEDFKIGVSLFKQICTPFRIPLLNNYIQDKYHIKNKKKHYYFKNNHENILVNLRYPCITITTDVNVPTFFLILYLYDKNIFVADFENHDYFWLTREFLMKAKDLKK